jgi:hypothetical protein
MIEDLGFDSRTSAQEQPEATLTDAKQGQPMNPISLDSTSTAHQ